ncbi:prepilin-type N-terminal cleavage/methylation domain-containing protein [Limnohabitans sp.]|uniref:prepilin-type N-terminal cleavage/methylation domain-containing protein n=1 Tax=Limnohabitans sp. TaxID=1907725 RepID=UPI00286F44EA|nr:prepilin-type N-terminal cleavage/methylation domain-containing protein [Limnohabitans sp.]
MRAQRGFTLIELLIAITLMAVLAGLSWRGLDSLIRSRDITQAQVNKTAVVQTVLAQWQADLNAVHPAPPLNNDGVQWDGRTLRMTRRAATNPADGADAGLWVVGWTLRNKQWIRWQSPPVRDHATLQQAWTQVDRWGQTPGSEDAALETVLLPLEAWQLTYFRSNTWVNPLSSSSSLDKDSSQGALPDGIRLKIDLPNNTGMRGSITLDWVRPNFSNTKT